MRRASDAVGLPGWRRREEVGIQAQTADKRGPAADGIGQLMDGEAAVAHEDDCAPWQPAALDGVIHPDDYGAVWNKAADDQAQQAARHKTGAPPRPIKELVVAGKIARIRPSGHAQAGADRALARGKHSSQGNHQHVLPSGRRETRLQELQPAA